MQDPTKIPNVKAQNCPKIVGFLRLDTLLFFPLAGGRLFDEVRDFFFFIAARFFEDEALTSFSALTFSVFRFALCFTLFLERSELAFEFEDDVVRLEFGKTPPYLLLKYTTKLLT